MIQFQKLSQASQVATTSKSLNVTAHPSCRVLPYRELKINKEEILLRGKTLFLGYLDKRGRIQHSKDTKGWFHTKDRGFVDKNNNLKILGRMDNMFISAGENIQPEEIEQAIYKIKTIQRAIIIPIEDPVFGLQPLAFIKTTNKKLLNPSVLAKHLEKNLPKFKIPKTIKPWPKIIPWQNPKINRSLFKNYI